MQVSSKEINNVPMEIENTSHVEKEMTEKKKKIPIVMRGAMDDFAGLLFYPWCSPLMAIPSPQLRDCSGLSVNFHHCPGFVYR